MEPNSPNRDNAELERLAKAACAKFRLKRLYFAEPVGRRMHFLAGYGPQGFGVAEKIPLGKAIVVFALSGAGTPEDYRDHLASWIAERLPQSPL